MFDFNIALPLNLVIFLVTLFLLNRLLFRPVFAVMERRASLTSGAKAEAAKSAEQYRQIFDRYQSKIKAAHQEGYRQKDALRAEAYQARKKCLDSTQGEAQQIISGMKSDLAVQVLQCREHLGRESLELAETIASKILLRNN